MIRKSTLNPAPGMEAHSGVVHLVSLEPSPDEEYAVTLCGERPSTNFPMFSTVTDPDPELHKCVKCFTPKQLH